MKPEERIKRINEQIAHTKVLQAVAEERLQDARRNITAWTKQILTEEAMIATFTFRIQDFEEERDRFLTARMRARRTVVRKRAT